MASVADRERRDWRPARPPPRPNWFNSDTELQRPGRIALYLVGLALLAVLSVEGVGDGLDGLVALLLVFAALPMLRRRYGGARPWWPNPPDRRMPARVWAPPLLLCVALLAAIEFVPRWGLGDPFWIWLTILPLVELLAVLAERSFRTQGADSWPETRRPRPLRDAALVGIGMAALLTLAQLDYGDPLTTALAYGLTIGAAFFALFYFDGRRRLRRGVVAAERDKAELSRRQ